MGKHSRRGEWGRVVGTCSLTSPGGLPAPSISTVRRVLADYEKAKVDMPEHGEDEVALIIGPVVDNLSSPNIAWYADLDRRYT